MRYLSVLLVFLLASSLSVGTAYAACPASFQSYAACPTHACIDCSGNNQVAYYYIHDSVNNVCNRGSPITRDCNVNPIRQDLSTSYTDMSCTWGSSVSAACTQGRSDKYPWPSNGYTTSACYALNVVLNCVACYCGMGTSSCNDMSCDTSPPTVGIVGAPANWASTASLTVSCTDDVAGCARTQWPATWPDAWLKRYDTNPSQCSTNQGEYNIPARIGTGTVVNTYGWYCATARDNLLKYGFTSSAVEVKVDSQSPTITVSESPDASSSWQTGVTVSVGCTDDGSCDTNSFKLKRYTTDPGATCPAAEVEYNVADNDQPGSGTYWYCAYGKDAVGNSDVSDSPVKAMVDSGAPMVTVTGAPQGWASSATATVTCSDDSSGCQAGSFRMELVGPQDPCPSAYDSYTITANSQPMTDYKRVCGTAKDNAGNTGFGSAVFQVDSQDPSLSDFDLSGEKEEGSEWYKSSVTVTPSCSDNSGSCTMTWCIDTDDSCDPQNRLGQGSFIVDQQTYQGTAYARVRATDPAGNNAVKSEAVRIDTTQPTLTITVTDQDNNPVSTQHVPERVTSVTVTASGDDGESGLKEIEFEYIHLGEKVVPEAQTKVCTSSPCTLTHGLSGLMYRATARDSAGNSYILPAQGWYYAVHHPLVNFLAQDAFLEMGNIYTADVMVRNIGTQADNVTVWIGSSYRRASFISGEGGYSLQQNDRLLVVEDLLPQETRLFTIKVLPMGEPKNYRLEINATSSVSSVTDGDSMSILLSYPASFPGLEMWAVALLVSLSGLAYWRRLGF